MTIESLKPKDFPYLLHQIADPPKKLFIQGTLPQPEAKILCVVGARKYTGYGKEVTEKLISRLAGHSIYIVSGLAIGIDSIAHQAALNAGLPTIAVPGSGLDSSILYPASNRMLAEQILDAGGALISEFEPTMKAGVWSFPQRNRIMAGMSHATLIIEAERKSGTLITASLAATYNRHVLTIPGSIFSRNSEGPHYLLRTGATSVTSSQDILEALGIENEHAEIPTYHDCSTDEKTIIKLLSQPLTRDQLLAQSNFSISTLNINISLLELKDYIVESAGFIRLKHQ